MKDKYFGDINDYRKYGLLRALTQPRGFKIGMCWLRTAPDGRQDGEARRYLEQPEQWRHRDPSLYDSMRRLSESVSGAERAANMATTSQQRRTLLANRFFSDRDQVQIQSMNHFFPNATTIRQPESV